MRIQAGNADVLAKVNDQVKNELHIYSAIAGQNCHLHLWHFGVNHVLVFTQRLSWHTHTHTHTHAGMPNHSPSATLWGQLCTGIYTTPVVTHTHREAKSLTICNLFGSILYWYLHNAYRHTHTHTNTHTHTPGGQITHHLRLIWVNHVLAFTQRLSWHTHTRTNRRTHTHTQTHTYARRPNHSPSATLWGQSCTGNCRQPHWQMPSCGAPGSRGTTLSCDQMRASLQHKADT